MFINPIRRQPGGHWGRVASLAGAVALAATVLTTSGAGQARAADLDFIWLTNASGHPGMGAAGGVVQDSLIDLAPMTGGEWATAVVPGFVNEFEFHAVTSKGAVTNWCIAVTANQQAATLQACGANGTVFIAERQSLDGWYLESRFLINYGYDDVLAVTQPVSGRLVTAVPVSDVGGNVYGQWSDEGYF